MKRIHPLIALAVVLLMFIIGLLLQVLGAIDCMDRGGAAVGAMTRNQGCAGQ